MICLARIISRKIKICRQSKNTRTAINQELSDLPPLFSSSAFGSLPPGPWPASYAPGWPRNPDVGDSHRVTLGNAHMEGGHGRAKTKTLLLFFLTRITRTRKYLLLLQPEPCWTLPEAKMDLYQPGNRLLARHPCFLFLKE